MDWSLLVQIIVEELERASENHSCIMAAAVILDVLSHLGINNAYPLTVKPRILNPDFVERLKHEPFPDTPEKLTQWEVETGCSIVAIGYENIPTNQWNGHLIVVIPEAFTKRDAALDITITQANVPDWGIELAPLMMAVPKEFLRGQREFKATVNGSQVVYMAFPEDNSFEETPIWNDIEKRNHIVQEIESRWKILS